jgi:predicted TPR repeat methyltransferase
MDIFFRIFHKVEKASPYQYLAPLYDQMMDHVDYEHWAEYIVRLFNSYGNNITRLVDGGCGTGSLLIALKKRGYHVTGFDLSYEMVRLAYQKGLASVWQGDLRVLPFGGKWEAFLCLYDTLQYLKLLEVREFLYKVGKVLKEGGLLIFDVVTEDHILHYWSNYTERDRGDDWEYFRYHWYDRKLRCHHTNIEIVFIREKKIVQEEHIQWIYVLRDLECVIQESGFQILGQFEEFTCKPGDKHSDRIHFVLKKG